ncbi:MAG: hypothetical protein EP298_03540 [Gammaproteobacteria bacterium]|nr:MAG: hypothetical protein EP298_03540 [Gammaproteobacteria bacterium]
MVSFFELFKTKHNIFFLILCNNPTYALKVITLTPALTNLVNNLIDIAREDGLYPNVNIIATANAYNSPVTTSSYSLIGDEHNIQIDKIITLKPDLIIVWNGGISETMVNKLKQSNLDIVEVNAVTIRDIPTLIDQIGELIGLEESAKRLENNFQESLAKLKPNNALNKKVFVELSETPLYTIGGKGFLNEIISFCGGENIYKDIKKFVFKVSRNEVIQKQPDIILKADGFSTSNERFKSTRWENHPEVNAVKDNMVYGINPQLVSQPTLEILKGIKSVCQIIQNNKLSGVIS